MDEMSLKSIERETCVISEVKLLTSSRLNERRSWDLGDLWRAYTRPLAWKMGDGGQGRKY